MRKQDIEEFVSFVKNDLTGDERGQAQTFCDRLFRAYGQKGIFEAQGKLEARIKIADTNTTNYIDCLCLDDGIPDPDIISAFFFQYFLYGSDTIHKTCNERCSAF